MNGNEDKMATIGAIAKRLGLSKRTLQRAAQMGYLRTVEEHTPLGPVRMTTEQDVQTWLASPKARPRKKGKSR